MLVQWRDRQVFRGWLVALAVWLPGCAGPLRTDIHDADPAAKIPALIDAARSPTEAERTALVEALGHDDAAVRMFAIESLRRVTGETLGYRAYDPPEARSEAAARWRAWLNAQQRGEEASGDGSR